MRKSNLILIFFLMALSCKKEPENNFPLIQTGEVTDVDTTGALFHAKIIDQGTENIKGYGFVWGLKPPPEVNSSKVTYSDLPENGIISEKISWDLEADTSYYMRAFLQNESYITYGRVVSFKSLGSISPEIHDFQPREGTAGTRVTITGENFSSRLTGNKVKIGLYTAIINEASTTELIVTLPGNVNISGYVKVIVETAGHIVCSGQKFFLQGCTIIGFKPAELMAGDKIYIHASDFSSVITENEIRIGGLKAEIDGIISDTIVASVPYNATTGLNEISLKADNKTFTSDDQVFVKSPWDSIQNINNFYRIGAIGFSIGGNGYVGLGVNTQNRMVYEAFNDLWKYNADTEEWIRCADLPSVKRQNSVGFSIGSKGYVCLGHNGGGQFFNDLYEYDPAGNTWTKRSDFPGISRRAAFCMVIGNKAYVGSGYSGNLTVLYDFWEYDPSSDRWTRLADFPIETGYCGVGFASGNKGYFGLGNKISQEPFAKNGFWEYDPMTNAWTRLSDFPGSERLRAVGFSIGGNGYIGLGRKISSYYDPVFNDFWRYDARNDRWTRISDFPFMGRWDAVSFTINNKGFICSGNNKDDGYGNHAESLIVFSPDGK